VHHGFAKILCAGLAFAMTQNDVVSRAIVADGVGIVNGDIVGALIELAHGISECIHDVGDEPVGFIDGTSGIVDELLLDEGPLLNISLPSRSRAECGV
jgi:hypothetical protein